MTPKVSVIMRSKNSDWVIGQTLSGLFSQNFKNFELIVVDSGSTDRTLEIVQQYPCRLLQIDGNSYYPGPVMNMAIKQAFGEIVVFLNSDTVPLSPYSLERLIAPFEDPKVAATFARQVPRPEALSWVRRDYAVSFPASGPKPHWITLSVPMAALRRSVWKERPFYTEAFGSEDTEWGRAVEKLGYKVLYVPEALVMHSHNYTLEEIYRRRFVEGEADVFIYAKRDTIGKVLMRTAKSILRDSAYCIKSLDLKGILMSVPRRVVYHWSYYLGHKLGERRKQTGNTDISIGQRVVLPNHKERLTT